MVVQYRLLKDSKLEPKAVAGSVVYRLRKHDYGLSRDDERILGYPCESVTLNSDGDYPSFVVPLHDLQEIPNDTH